VRSLAQWSRASEVVFSKSSAPNRGLEKRMCCWSSTCLGAMLVSIHEWKEVTGDTGGRGIRSSRVYTRKVETSNRNTGISKGRVNLCAAGPQAPRVCLDLLFHQCRLRMSRVDQRIVAPP
jgi:hypothetical protein